MTTDKYTPPTSNYVTLDREIDIFSNFKPDIKEIINSLSKINRFNGHTVYPYSVARHSLACVAVAMVEYEISNPELLLVTLFHDAAEAYIGDIVRPIKYTLCKDLLHLEESIQLRILKMFKFTEDEWKNINEFIPTLRTIDDGMAATEADKLTHIKILPEVKRFKKSYIIKSTWDFDHYEFNALTFALHNLLIKQRTTRDG